MRTAYAALKKHFDRLINGEFLQNTGLEPIRDTYADCFGKPINLYEVYQSRIIEPNNPVSSILTLVGPDNDDIPTGLMWDNKDKVSVNLFDEDQINYGVGESEIEGYIKNVYESMRNITVNDRFYRSGFGVGEDPYRVFISLVPFYFTYHHVNDCLSHVMVKKPFIELLEKYIMVKDCNVEAIYDSVSKAGYSDEIEDIYKAITDQNKIVFL